MVNLPYASEKVVEGVLAALPDLSDAARDKARSLRRSMSVELSLRKTLPYVERFGEVKLPKVPKRLSRTPEEAWRTAAMSLDADYRSGTRTFFPSDLYNRSLLKPMPPLVLAAQHWKVVILGDEAEHLARHFISHGGGGASAGPVGIEKKVLTTPCFVFLILFFCFLILVGSIKVNRTFVSSEPKKK